MNRIRLIGVCAAVAVGATAVPATASAAARHHDERLDLGRPAGDAAGQGLHQEVPGHA